MLLVVAYDGSFFSGWAAQPSVPTVAGTLERALAAVAPAATRVRGASRTDAGVHARGQLVAFDTARAISPRGWVHALNDGLPAAVAVVRAATVGSGFDPRRSARAKRYRYVLLGAPVRDPHWERRAWRVGYRLNQDLMAAEAASLVGTHDFRAFRSSADDRGHTVRTIRRTEVRSARGDHRLLEILVEGDGFLHNMVRIIVGTLVDVGRGRLSAGTFTRALASGRRGDLGPTAPAAGLYLDHIELGVSPLAWWPDAAPLIDWPGTVA